MKKKDRNVNYERFCQAVSAAKLLTLAMATLILGLGLVMFLGLFFMDDTTEYFS